ncbi:VOC family protein [Pseudoroseicyclus sp. CXY001]|uniref:VOC family protein n=1 Tax=Pseudoroseicyclus sp. CXY001 TaxID=3242492 RepID=UPI003571675C
MRLDHLVILCADLADGISHVAAALGVTPAPGGRHALFGTHNAVVSLGGGTYLEVLAPDPEAPVPERPRWFGLDLFEGPPRLANWACAVDDLDAALDAAPFAGEPLDLARGALRWRIAVPADGALPMGGAFPTLLEWQSPPPGETLPDAGLRLRSLAIQAPHAGEALEALGGALPDPAITLTGAERFRLSAEIDTPHGPRHLA